MELSLALGKYATIRRDSHNYVTHLLFADDMLVLSKASKSSLKEIKFMLEKLGCSIFVQKEITQVYQ